MRTHRVVETAGTALLAGLYVSFACTHYLAFTATHRPSLVLAVVTETMLIGFIVVRRAPSCVSLSPAAWASALGGTLAPLLLRPLAGAGDQPAGIVVQCAGTAMSVAAIAALNRSFGLLPAHRGIRRNGMYRVVRHPLYVAYTVTGIGYLINHPSARNAVVVAAGFCLQLARLVNEERLLSRDPEYVAYKTETRWRLLPFVF